MAIPKPTNESMLIRLVRNNKYFADRGNYKNVKAAIIPTSCKKMRVVPVAVRPCATKKLRPIDVQFRSYVSLMLPHSALCYNMDEIMTTVEHYQSGGPSPIPFGYTIFTSNHTIETMNTLLRTFAGAGDMQIRGNILVVKHLKETGELVSIDVSELYFIQRVVVDTFQSTGRTPFYPPAAFPVIPTPDPYLEGEDGDEDGDLTAPDLSDPIIQEYLADNAEPGVAAD